MMTPSDRDREGRQPDVPLSEALFELLLGRLETAIELAADANREQRLSELLAACEDAHVFAGSAWRADRLAGDRQP